MPTPNNTAIDEPKSPGDKASLIIGGILGVLIGIIGTGAFMYIGTGIPKNTQKDIIDDLKGAHEETFKRLKPGESLTIEVKGQPVVIYLDESKTKTTSQITSRRNLQKTSTETETNQSIKAIMPETFPTRSAYMVVTSKKIQPTSNIK